MRKSDSQRSVLLLTMRKAHVQAFTQLRQVGELQEINNEVSTEQILH